MDFSICFRYTPDQYPSEVEWSARLMLERSLAIKCPSIHYHLAGTKKVQQRLAEKGMLEYFFPGPQNAAKVEKIRSIFTGLYELSKEVSKPPFWVGSFCLFSPPQRIMNSQEVLLKPVSSVNWSTTTTHLIHRQMPYNENFTHYKMFIVGNLLRKRKGV